MKAQLLLALCGTLAANAPHSPQLTDYERGVLKGVNAVQIIVENLASDADRCNLDKEGIRVAVARPLVDAGIVVAEKNDTHIYVHVNSIPLASGLCVASVSTSARVLFYAKLPYSVSPADVVEVMLWESGEVMTGPPSEFGQRVRTAVRENADAFATKVKLANVR